MKRDRNPDAALERDIAAAVMGPELADEMASSATVSAPAKTHRPVPLEQIERAALMDFLGNLMQEWSQDVYCAGWLVGLEDLLPRLCERAIQTGREADGVKVEDARRMAAIAGRLGHWVRWELGPDMEDTYVPHHPGRDQCDGAGR